jgi:AcrR family transcriptional regulator
VDVVERADAARNRRAILAAAECLVRDSGAVAVSIDEVARLADVGKGTVFRRFGSRLGLLTALVNQYEQAIDRAACAVLDHGTDPVEEALAFVDVIFEQYLFYRPLIDALHAEVGGAPWGGACAQIRARLVDLIARARPDGDADFLAYVIMSTVHNDLFRHLAEVRGLTVDDIRGRIRQLAADLLTGVPR